MEHGSRCDIGNRRESYKSRRDGGCSRPGHAVNRSIERLGDAGNRRRLRPWQAGKILDLRSTLVLSLQFECGESVGLVLVLAEQLLPCLHQRGHVEMADLDRGVSEKQGSEGNGVYTLLTTEEKVAAQDWPAFIELLNSASYCKYESSDNGGVTYHRKLRSSRFH